MLSRCSTVRITLKAVLSWRLKMGSDGADVTCNGREFQVHVTSVTFRYCVQMNEVTIMRFSASGRTIILVSGERLSLSGYFQSITPSEGVKVRQHSTEGVPHFNALVPCR